MRLDRIMSAPVETIVPTASAAEARAAMQRAGLRHLVVVGRGRQILGVLCDHDLREAEPGSTVGDVMSAPPVTLSVKAGVEDAAKLLRRWHVGSLPLTDGGRLAGIVTTSDLLRLLGSGGIKVQPQTRKWTLAKRGPTHRPEGRRH